MSTPCPGVVVTVWKPCLHFVLTVPNRVLERTRQQSTVYNRVLHRARQHQTVYNRVQGHEAALVQALPLVW